MLKWNKDGEIWQSNGFVVRLVAPSRWALTERRGDDNALVQEVPTPLAITRTLSGAKREAELLSANVAESERRKAWTGQLLASIAAAFISIGFAEPWNMFASFAFTGTALYALAKIVGSWISRWVGHPKDVFYQ